MITYIASAALETLLKLIELAPFLRYPFPSKNPFESEILSAHGVKWIEFQSAEESPPCNLTGWACRPPSPVGTVFLLHGFRENSYNQWIVEAAERFIGNLNLAVVAPDFRNHGKSEKRIPSFGFAESLDVSGAMNWAESQGYPKPYLLHGGSLGAIAAKICAIRDPRVSGAFLKASPASAGVALKNCIQINKTAVKIPGPPQMISAAINAAYSYDVVHWSDVKSYPSSPDHRPRVFYALGQFDEYGYDATRSSFDHWYQGEEVKPEVPPAAAWGQSKWFRTAWGAYHDFGLKEYPEMHTDVDDFFRLCVRHYNPLSLRVPRQNAGRSA
jgi:pimeloyl-ACP methyl ester carboxylesterase